jgi:uncharacterized protein YndB with AHSA1/START domain
MIRPLRAIVLEARFDASPAAVWQALTESQGLANWFAPFIKAQQGVGGIVEMSWDGTNTWPTTIEVWDPERHLRWADPAPPAADGTPQPRLMVDWSISTDAGQTVLRLVHSGFGEGANWDEQIDGTSGGWKYFLWNLGVCLTSHRGTARTMVSSRRQTMLPRDVFWESLFSSGLITMDHASHAPDTCALTLGTRSFEGRVETCEPPYRFAAQIPSLDDALLFIELEGGAASGFHAGFWLSTYGIAPNTTGELQRALDDTVARLVEPAVPATL